MLEHLQDIIHSVDIAQRIGPDSFRTALADIKRTARRGIKASTQGVK